jgi:hypothetical protein
MLYCTRAQSRFFSALSFALSLSRPLLCSEGLHLPQTELDLCLMFQ